MASAAEESGGSLGVDASGVFTVRPSCLGDRTARQDEGSTTNAKVDHASLQKRRSRVESPVPTPWVHRTEANSGTVLKAPHYPIATIAKK